jgi:hypothetical protein
LRGLKSLKHLQLESLSGLDKAALDGARIGDIELSGTRDDLLESLQHEGLLARLAPARSVHVGTTIEIEEKIEEFRRFILDGTAELPSAGALEVIVVGNMRKSFPESIRVLDLLRANLTKLTLNDDLPFLRRLIVPAVLEETASVCNCPRLDEIVFGDAPVREVGMYAFVGALSLDTFSVPETLRNVDKSALFGSGICRLDASGCSFLEWFALGTLPGFLDLILPSRFSGVLHSSEAKEVNKAIFGSIELKAPFNKYIIVFGKIHFTSLTPPRGDFISEMFAEALVFSETSQLLGREAGPARPP